ncbi:MAG: SDR family oxidoreductase [bacterium]|nr:SDR family oxidoreductase [bacterium]
MSPHLVIGASGQVGGHLLREGLKQGLPMRGTYHTHAAPDLLPLDIRDHDAAAKLFLDLRPSVVYLPAAYVNVDACETHPEETFATNVLGTVHVVRAANAVGARLVFFSSDYIFDGTSGPYREEDVPHPISEYGWHKLTAEHAVALHAKTYLIIRTTVVYSWERQGKNFVERLLRDLQQGETINVSEDQVGNATYAPNLAQAVLELTLQDVQGIFHVCGPERTSRYAFAAETARVFGFDERRIRPVSTDRLHQVAQRPLNAGMITDKVSALLTTPLLGYREGLRVMMRERVTVP